MCDNIYVLQQDNEQLRKANEYLRGLIGRVNQLNIQLQKELARLRTPKAGWYQDWQDMREDAHG